MSIIGKLSPDQRKLAIGLAVKSGAGQHTVRTAIEIAEFLWGREFLTTRRASGEVTLARKQVIVERWPTPEPSADILAAVNALPGLSTFNGGITS